MDSLVASVVIPTRNRPQALEYCLDALAEQSLPPGSFEVIVVDDGSESALSLDPARWAAKFHLKLIRQKNTGPGGARNRGATEARGEFIAFTDDDCLPTANWLEKLVSALRQQPAALVGGSTFNGLNSDIFAETSQLIVELVYRHFNSHPQQAYFFASNNMACSRRVFDAVGGFDTNFNLASEDREFCDRWRMNRHQLVWEQDALMEHRHGQSFFGFTELHFRYGKGAWQYQATRRRRKSGSLRKDTAFHWTLTPALLRILPRYSLKKRGQIVLLLGWWQIINALGFASRAVRARGCKAPDISPDLTCAP
jgi:GT2 family glycosyltransferase